MTRARQEQVCLDATPYYHCIARCVRRAFLCGEDVVSGRNFDHRKQWLVDRLKQLSGVFAIDICAYAVMSNHYHVVLKIDKERVLQWSMDEVIQRWQQLYKGALLIQRYQQQPETLSPAELETVFEIVEVWRQRLYDLGWFMRCLNEFIARQANVEDKCRGHFWEGRYKSVALLDEAALLSCMMYVDLNPIRAGVTDKLEEAEFTSIYERLQCLKTDLNVRTAKGLVKKLHRQTTVDLERQVRSPKALLAFASQVTSNTPALPFSLREYIELMEWTGRCIREDKQSAIPENSALTFERLGINTDYWLEHIQLFGQRYAQAAGSEMKMIDFGEQVGYNLRRGVRGSRCVYR